MPAIPGYKVTESIYESIRTQVYRDCRIEEGAPVIIDFGLAEAVRQAIAEMARLLAEGDAEAADLMSDLRSALAGAGLDASLDTLEEHIDAFDFEDAIDLLNEIGREAVSSEQLPTEKVGMG